MAAEMWPRPARQMTRIRGSRARATSSTARIAGSREASSAMQSCQRGQLWASTEAMASSRKRGSGSQTGIRMAMVGAFGRSAGTVAGGRS